MRKIESRSERSIRGGFFVFHNPSQVQFTLLEMIEEELNDEGFNPSQVQFTQK